MRTQHCSADSRSHGVPGALNSKLGRLGTANIYFSVPAFVVLFRESLEVRLHSYDLQLRPSLGHLSSYREKRVLPRRSHYVSTHDFVDSLRRGRLGTCLNHLSIVQLCAAHKLPNQGLECVWSLGQGKVCQWAAWSVWGLKFRHSLRKAPGNISEHILVLQSAGRTRSWT